ncbi:MAG TPA: hypothetical protein VMQ81_03820 [Acidimicrobiia bacterium]|nr:hypothetical protein [Acidimicrobiia bacterium]
MVNRYLVRTLITLSVAAMLLVGLAPAAHAEKTKTFQGNTVDLKADCSGDYIESVDGSFGVCFSKDKKTVTTCDDASMGIQGDGKNCTQTTRVRKPTLRLVNALVDGLLARDALRAPPDDSGTTGGGNGGGNGGGTGSTTTTRPTNTTTPTTTSLPSSTATTEG